MSATETQKTVVCFGDSITAGYGLKESDSYPEDLNRLLAARHILYRVINRGVPGDTTTDALTRLPTILALHPQVVVVEFGGNDGLRGIDVHRTRANLMEIVSRLQAAKIRVLLVGITLPPNYGPDYVRSFQQVFVEVARAEHVLRMPMIYDGIYTIRGTIQSDGIHPTAKGSEMIAEHMLPYLKPLLR
jgi:acyl-CoA thioesterase-1